MWKESTRIVTLSKETLASLTLDLEKAVSQLEDINQTLFELKPEDDEPEY